MADNDKIKSADMNSALSSGVSRLSLIRNTTRECLSNMTKDELRDADYVESTILDTVQTEIDLANAIRSKGHKWKTLDELIPAQIADIIAYIYPVARIMTGGVSSDEDYDLLAIYQEDGPEKGTYVVSEQAFRKLARQYDYGITNRGFEEMMTVLRDEVRRVVPCKEKNLIAVNNGIFDYDTKQLLPFSEDMVFLTKSKVDYNPNAKNVVIHNDADGSDWDVESWMNSLSDDAEVVNTLWEVIGAIIRPLVPWNKSAWFYSETGNNGKGTLCELMRQICGDGTYASIALSEFGKDFMLEPLTHSSAIIVDENDVGTYIDKAANLKAIITGDTLQINRKFKQPIAYQFHGFMVQCLNEMPKIKDKSDSFFRRQLFIPFTKCFTGVERKYIKQDYLHRKEVLEYVLYKVLNMNYYSLSTPSVCEQALDEYKDFVDPVREFMKEHMPIFKWDLLPFGFLYDCYCSWYKSTAGNDRNMKGRQSFIKDVRVLLETTYVGWAFVDGVMRPTDRMDEPEPLIDEYNLDKWMNPLYKNSKDRDKRCTTPLKSTYRGIYRLVRQKGSDMDNNVCPVIDVDNASVEEV